MPWFRQVFRDGRPGRNDGAVLAAANLAETFRPAFKRGPVTLRQFVNFHPTSVGWDLLEGPGAPVAAQKQVEKKPPFWTKQNLEMIRGLVAAGFTLKAKPAEAVGGGARRKVKMSRAKLDT